MPVEKSQPAPSPDPSMEEIIASISRIIAEDKDPADRRVGTTAQSHAGAVAPGEKSDILELTQVVNEDGSVRRVSPWAEFATAPPISPGVPTGSPADPAERSEPRPSPADAAREPKLDPGRERIVSAATSGAAAAAFAQLGALPRERRNETELPLGAGERTLEEMVREMLRPLLQAWLDDHLPVIVERLVREEIGRVVGEAGLR
jgi:cell pole-organizing protein PopZ